MRAEASLLIAAVAASPVAAACVCVCDDGRSRPVCESAADDLPPFCPPRPCAIEAPPITALPGAKVRTLGTAGCPPTRVYDQATGNFEWVRLCN